MRKKLAKEKAMPIKEVTNKKKKKVDFETGCNEEVRYPARLKKSCKALMSASVVKPHATMLKAIQPGPLRCPAMRFATSAKTSSGSTSLKREGKHFPYNRKIDLSVGGMLIFWCVIEIRSKALSSNSSTPIDSARAD